MTMALRKILVRCLQDEGPIGIVCHYPLFKHLTREFEEHRNRFVWIDEAKPDKIMGMDFKHIVYKEKPNSKHDRCLFICWKRVLRLDGRIFVPCWANTKAYHPEGLSNRMENY